MDSLFGIGNDSSSGWGTVFETESPDYAQEVPIDWTPTLPTISITEGGGNQDVGTDTLNGSLNSLFSNMMQTANGIVGIISKLKQTPSASQILGYKLASQQQTQSSYLMIGVLLVVGVLLFSFMKK